MTPEFANNPAFVTFEKQLRLLHEWISAGEGDSDKADLLRSEMADNYRSLSAHEVEHLNGLSEDLYSLSEEPDQPASTPKPNQAQTASEIIGARALNNWHVVLSGLRQIGSAMSAYDLAFQRYQAYARLGQYETALLFLRRAVQLNRADPKTQHILFDFLNRHGHVTEARERARALLAERSGVPALLVVSAAHIRFEEVRQWPVETSLPILRHLTKKLERALANLARKDIPGSVLILGWTTLGSILDSLGNVNGAMAAFDKVVKLDPLNPLLRIMRGLTLASHDQERAVVEFEAAIELGSQHIIPYRFLAAYALVQQQWAKAHGYAERLVQLAGDPTLKAEARQWQAISEFELGREWQEVENLFQEAQALAPENGRIAENFRKCLASRNLSVGERATIPWSRLEASDFPPSSVLIEAALALPS